MLLFKATQIIRADICPKPDYCLTLFKHFIFVFRLTTICHGV